MCGIAAIYDPSGCSYIQLMSRIQKMTSYLVHRGPNDCGFHVDRSIALGHRRLSIIDLATGRQPIFNEDKTKCIIFNGEIYNYPDLRAELLDKGHCFTTNSDTETILHAYEEWGVECLKRLTGMFAFCIWDQSNETLFLARDRVGEKPLFYSQQGRTFVFASEMKSILADPALDRAIDDEALASYFIFGYVPNPLTIYKSIRKLPPGHYAVLKNGQLSVRQYWDVVFEPNYRKKENDFIGEIMDLLRGAVKQQLISEVPLGAFLSGGIDSSAIVALMTMQSREAVKTFTIGFICNAKGYEDERHYARLVAERYRTSHQEHVVTPHADGILDKIVRAFDEPFGDDSTIPSYFVCQMARQNVTVALSGLGGDEAFAGYSRYVGYQLSQIYNRIPALLREGVITRLVERVPEGFLGGNKVSHLKRFVRSAARDDAHRYLGFISKLPDRYRSSFFSGSKSHLSEAFEAAQARFVKMFDSAPADDPINKVFYCDIKTYLPDDILTCTDRMSMHHSLEVRVPFLNHQLIEYSATIPPEMKLKLFRPKHLLKKCVSDLLPAAVLRHRKRGFVGPTEVWVKGELRKFTEEKLSRTSLARHSIFDQNTIHTILEDHYTDKENNDVLIWCLLNFQVWFDEYMN